MEIEKTTPEAHGSEPHLLEHYPVSDATRARLAHVFTYHAPHEDQIPRYRALRDQAHALAVTIVSLTPPSREQSLALTKLEEAVMHANSAIAREPRG